MRPKNGLDIRKEQGLESSILARPSAAGNGKDPSARELRTWAALEAISQHQRRILENWTHWFHSGWGLAPGKLSQSILPDWNFGIEYNIDETRTSNPEAELDIVQHVAGYGSQLGTILDYLELLEKRVKLADKTGLSALESDKVKKLLDLVAEVNRAKRRIRLKKKKSGTPSRRG